jgi:sugar lactone lactonase YvrE
MGGDVTVNADGVAFVTTTTFADAANVGRVVRVAPDETSSYFGPPIKLRYGRLHGVAVDTAGKVYVAAASYGAEPNRIFRVTQDKAILVATTPGSRAGYSAPNGLAFHDGWLYVTDPFAGAIWRFAPGDSVIRLTEPWVSGALLRSTTPGWLGANGIAFRKDVLFFTNTDKGLVAKVPQGRLGNAGTPTVVAQRPQLVGADGLAFDRHGRIWVAVAGPLHPDEVTFPLTGQYLIMLTRTGDVREITKDAPWMDSPNSLAPGSTPRSRNRMLVLNGSEHAHTPELLWFVLR